MISAWVLRGLVAGVLVCGAAMAADRVAAWYRRPRRWIWVVAMAASILVPVVAYVAPGLMPVLGADRAATAQLVAARVVRSGTSEVVVGALAPASEVAEPAPLRGPTAVIVWLMTSVALGAVVLAVARRLRRLRDHAPAAEIDGYTVRVTESFGPAVVGLRDPAIVVPKWIMDIPDPDRRLMLTHEREHIQAGDHWLLAAAACGIVVMPWNVMLWWQYARLRFAVEADCDARLLARGADARVYGRALLLAAQPHPIAVLAPVWGASGEELRQRISAITAGTPRARAIRALPLLLATAGLVAIACDVTQPDPLGRAASTSAVVPADSAPESHPSVTGLGDSMSFYSLRMGHVRVTGYTRERMPARVRLTGGGGKMRLVSESVVLKTVGDSVIELLTPAILRIEGEQYTLVAEAVEIGTEVEIAGTAPRGFGTPQAGSARGPAPMLNFTKPRVPIAPNKPVSSVPSRSGVVDSVIAAPGTIELHSATSTEEWVRVTGGEGVSVITTRGGRLHTQLEAKKVVDVQTPARLQLSPGDEYFVRFEALRSGASLRVSAANNSGSRFSGQYDVPFVICGTARFSLIGGYDGKGQSAADCRE